MKEDRYILLPGPKIRGSISMTDFDIEIGFGKATVVDKSVIENSSIQKFIKEESIIAEKYDPSLRKRVQPDPCVGVSIFSYGKHKVGLHFADLARVTGKDK